MQTTNTEQTTNASCIYSVLHLLEQVYNVFDTACEAWLGVQMMIDADTAFALHIHTYTHLRQWCDRAKERVFMKYGQAKSSLKRRPFLSGENNPLICDHTSHCLWLPHLETAVTHRSLTCLTWKVSSSFSMFLRLTGIKHLPYCRGLQVSNNYHSCCDLHVSN